MAKASALRYALDRLDRDLFPDRELSISEMVAGLAECERARLKSGPAPSPQTPQA